jgi:pyruvate ferredoxin oxidoreductase alpha subunit
MRAEQRDEFLTGNEMVAEAARAIQFHFMGFYPITPSTEIAQLIDAMRARGEVSTVLLAADGEHGAAGACFGASTGGARVLNATSANGFLYSLEQLPVQAGTRLPMVLNLVTRSVSGPLDIRCDHSDLMYALQTGWILLMASTPQAVYDMNILAVKLGEHPEVRLPVMVVSDGFFTSHQRASVQIFKNSADVQKFLGPRQDPVTALDPRKPVTVGPYMNDLDLINNKYQLHQAHEKALEVFKKITAEYEELTGRSYPALECHRIEDAETALFLLNSAAETAKDAVDRLREKGKKVGVIKPNLLRPFPLEELKAASHRLSSIVIGERADTPGSQGGPLSHEVRSALMSDHHCDITALIRVYGLGGRDFKEEDAAGMLEQGLAAGSGIPEVPFFDFVGIERGTMQGTQKALPPQLLPALSREELSQGLAKVEKVTDAGSKQAVRAVVADLNFLAGRPKRIAPGHGACPGCGIFSGLDQFFKGIEGDVVVLYHTGCAMVVTTDYPFSAHRITYIHNLFQNGAPTLAGLVETFHEKKRRGEISVADDPTFIMITGDGGMDIGMGPTIGTALRNHRMIVLEYDNQGYMNTGGQLSYTTPFGKATTTSHVGKRSHGKAFHHKDTAAIMAATGIPYVFTAIEGLGTDLVEKAAKAQHFAQNEGLAYGKILVSCPLNWGSEERQGYEILKRAADCCFFPLYEIQHGLTTLNYDPEKEGRKLPVSAWLELMGKSQHLLRPEHAEALAEFQQEVDRRWKRLKAMAEHPLL